MSDDWEFKVDEEAIPESKSSPKKKKKKKKKAYAKPPQVKLVTKGKEKKKKAGMAMRQAALQQYGEIIPPNNKNRLVANAIDGIITLIIIFFSVAMTGPLKSFFFGQLQNVASEKQDMFLFLVSSIFLYIVFIVYPSASFKKSPGKYYAQIRIGTPELDIKAKFFQIFFRELIIKPLSVMTIVGAGLILINPARRALHDFICGTALYLDD